MANSGQIDAEGDSYPVIVPMICESGHRFEVGGRYEVDSQTTFVDPKSHECPTCKAPAEELMQLPSYELPEELR